MLELWMIFIFFYVFIFYIEQVFFLKNNKCHLKIKTNKTENTSRKIQARLEKLT